MIPSDLTINRVDNDLIFTNRRGLYRLSPEPERENLLDILANVTSDETPLLNTLRHNNRSRYIEDNDGICMCYKHRRIWREGADFKLGRRPRVGPGGACKECCLKAEI